MYNKEKLSKLEKFLLIANEKDEELLNMIKEKKSIIVVNKNELGDLLYELKTKTPEEIKRYQKIINNKEARRCLKRVSNNLK